MTVEIKPIKRSKELAQLSREHHDGLLFVWKLREGLKHKVTIARLKQYTIWFWQQHIKPHFFQEEKILVPHMPANNPLAVQMKKEHDCIRELILSLDKNAETTSFIHLADLLNNHIRFEERLLFPFLEQSLSCEELNIIYLQLEKHPVCAGIWEDEFWVKKN